jgi:hypothetical protein
MFFRLSRLARGVKSDDAPIFPIKFLLPSREILERLQRFARGVSRDYAPTSPIELLLKLSWMFVRF